MTEVEMENIIIWLVTVVLVLIIFVPYFLKFRKRVNRDQALKEESSKLGADRPIAQYPQIDQLKCIGCGSCVDACPEGGVLGIVFGKATIINGLKCVGHGLCAEACPVEGITVGLGDISKRDDIPVMNEYNETNIPGIYIAGELGGLALIRNAIAQGRMTVNRIAETLNKKDDRKDVVDVCIIGAGPAGLSAALTAIQHKLSYIVIDQQGAGGTILHYPRKKLVMTRPVEIPLYGWLEKPEYSKEELLEIWKNVERRFDLKMQIGERLTGAERENGFFKIKTSNGEYPARKVVLALGRRGTPRKLKVPGENQSKVMYRLQDAESYQNEHILVVGGGDSAVEAAIGLARQKGNTITLSYRKHKFYRIKKRNAERLDRLISDKKIRVVFNSNVSEIKEKSVVLSTNEGNTEIPNDYVFIFAGGEPPFKLLKEIGIRFGGEKEDSQKLPA